MGAYVWTEGMCPEIGLLQLFGFGMIYGPHVSLPISLILLVR